MITKYTYGTPFPTEAVVMDVPASGETPRIGEVSLAEGFRLICPLAPEDMVFGLGENVRGINKRGFRYVSDCSDEPHHHEDTASLYGAHNFLLICGEKTFGLFLDYPARMTFDVGFTKTDELAVSCEKADLDLYVIEGETPHEIVRTFRRMIGRSYIPPKFAFGYGQSRWSYDTADEVREVVRKHREAGVPLDTVYLDIDYMEGYKDFTVHPERFPDFAAFVEEMKEQHIRLVPIIDAGVKIEEGYSVYEEGKAKGYFCRRAEGSDFVAEVWPGWTHFPDVLNPEARAWFGDQYRALLDQGIEAFWNDMNEPAIFKTPEGAEEVRKAAREMLEDPAPWRVNEVKELTAHMMNNHADYARMYHRAPGGTVCHEDVHNLFGYNMTRAAAEAFDRACPEKRILLFSRSSYVGMHRYGGIWQGDNLSWWSHLLMNFKMMPSLNMVGFLYTGADVGGFGADTSRDLLLRWLAVGAFTPLMRNHSAIWTRRQEFYRFEHPEDFRNLIRARYRLIPYLYSEYMKAALGDDLMFRPLAFAWPEDPIARQTEDQLLFGDQVMLAPVFTQNSTGRFVYLPENMTEIRFRADGTIGQTPAEKGVRWVEIPLNELVFFLRDGAAIPIGPEMTYVRDVSPEELVLIGSPGAEYLLYTDDGNTKDYDRPEHWKRLSNQG